MKDWKEGVTREQISARLESWTESMWDACEANYREYKAAMGDEAWKTFEQFAWGIAAQNVLFDLLTAEEAA